MGPVPRQIRIVVAKLCSLCLARAAVLLLACCLSSTVLLCKSTCEIESSAAAQCSHVPIHSRAASSDDILSVLDI